MGYAVRVEAAAEADLCEPEPARRDSDERGSVQTDIVAGECDAAI